MRPYRIFSTPCAVLLAVATWIPIAGAQSRPDPADPAARVPAATYRSPFADYRLLGEVAVGDWRAANDEVARIGGWREYAREVQEVKEKPPVPSGAPLKPAPAASPHGAHGGKP